jgi:NifU-like protein involved in Fe-S cluster formation
MGKYADPLMGHFLSPRNCGKMDAPDRVGLVGTPGQTLFMLVCLRVEGDTVVDARYQTNGCGASIAAGSVLTEVVKGKTVGACLALTADDVAAALGGVPPDKAHCPVLAVTALRNALREELSALGRHAVENGA